MISRKLCILGFLYYNIGKKSRSHKFFIEGIAQMLTQCEISNIFQPLRFCVKLVLVHWENVKVYVFNNSIEHEQDN